MVMVISVDEKGVFRGDEQLAVSDGSSIVMMEKSLLSTDLSRVLECGFHSVDR